VRNLLDAFVTEKDTADHQERKDQRGGEGADEKRGRDEDELVHERALGDRPDDDEFAVGLEAGDLLGVEGEVVADDAAGLLDRDLAEDGDIVEKGRDVVEEGEEAGAWLLRNDTG
jgi:hypothetical protein